MQKHYVENVGATADTVLGLYKDIAQFEKEIITELKLAFPSQAELSRALHISPQYVGDILRGRRGLSPKILKSITKLKVETKKQ